MMFFRLHLVYIYHSASRRRHRRGDIVWSSFSHHVELESFGIGFTALTVLPLCPDGIYRH